MDLVLGVFGAILLTISLTYAIVDLVLYLEDVF